MDESSVKKRVGEIVTDMQAVLAAGSIDARAHGKLCSMANEPGRLESELSDSKLRMAMSNAAKLVAGGISGYLVGDLAEFLAEIVVLL